MDPKSRARQCIELIRDILIDLSHKIHANPELGYKEFKATAWLQDALREAGFEVESNLCDLSTAFRAKSGNGPLHLAVCAEYDCLPEIGHACGHNIIAAAAVGAGIGAAQIADDVGLTVNVIGTPAEDSGNGGGKILLLERGAFQGCHAAMMVHPGPFDVCAPIMIAASSFQVKYTGKEAHASAFPEMGINAADALTIAQTAIGLLRQHIQPTDRIHGIITKGGDAANIVPASTKARYVIRSRTLDDMEELRTRVYRCFAAGALATGSQLEIIGGEKPYAQMRHDPDMVDAYKRNAESLGRTFPDLEPIRERVTGSTDMGNVSLAIPAIHPIIGIESMPAVNHQPEFTAHCVSDAADKALIDGAIAMAWTAIDIASDTKIRNRLLSGQPQLRNDT